MRRARATIGLVAALLVTACSAGCTAAGGPPPPPNAATAASAFVAAWNAGNWTKMAELVLAPPPDFGVLNEGARHDLGATKSSYVLGRVTQKGATATAAVVETYAMPLVPRWIVHTNLQLSLRANVWKVRWSPATIDPVLGSDGRFVVNYEWPPRAAVLAADGTPISPSTPTSAVIGLYGRYVTNRASLTRSLVEAGAPSSTVQASIAAAVASPTIFVPVFTVTWYRYEQIQDALRPVPGVFFESRGGAGTSTPAPLVGVVGTLGAVTKEELHQLGPPYDATSIIGQGGVEQTYERQLAGTPGVVIGVAGPDGKVRTTLLTVAARPGTAVRTTIDLTAETAAAKAISTLPNEAALVAIDVSTGRIIAAANTSQGSDLALEGAQPPGSTMKMITSTALIDKGLTPESPATCPKQIVVDGEHFHNAEPSEGSVPNLLSAFTVSCNTAFIGLTVAELGWSSLHDAALTYDVGGNWNPGIPVFTGSVPLNNGQTDFAASAIGQARVLLSPLDLAMVAADIDTGTVRLPWITDGAPTKGAPTTQLPTTLVDDLHEMMLSVVEHGTAEGTGLPQGTYAKTGTAEIGSTSPPAIDAWLAGFNGHIAFAVLDVQAKGFGGPTDGPVAAQFLDAMGL